MFQGEIEFSIVSFYFEVIEMASSKAFLVPSSRPELPFDACLPFRRLLASEPKTPKVLFVAHND
jgi:hypothetical protein